MHGKGTFFDSRLNDTVQFPVAARAGFGNVGNTPDLITANLAALHFYQLALPAPTPREEASTRTPRFVVKRCLRTTAAPRATSAARHRTGLDLALGQARSASTISKRRQGIMDSRALSRQTRHTQTQLQGFEKSIGE
jgi:hypothetical protein